MFVAYQYFKSFSEALDFGVYGNFEPVCTERTIIQPDGSEREVLGEFPDGTLVYPKQVYDEATEAWWMLADLS